MLTKSTLLCQQLPFPLILGSSLLSSWELVFLKIEGMFRFLYFSELDHLDPAFVSATQLLGPMSHS